MTDKLRPSRKPYTTPRLVEQGKVATITRQGPTPTPTVTPITSAFVTTFVDEF